MEHSALIGFAAGALCAIAYVPQILKVLSEKSANDISLRTMLVLGSGLGLWLIFGIIKSDIPIVVGNAISLTLVIIVIALKIRFG